jgi:GxxExxY protein
MEFTSAVDGITSEVLQAAIEVHRRLGPGLLESTYETCLAFELTARGLRVERQKSFPLLYRSITLEHAYRVDLLVQESVIVEIKAIEQLVPIHYAQLLSYLRLARLPVGLLINFNVTSLKRGIRRVVNSYIPSPRPPRSSASSAFEGNVE